MSALPSTGWYPAPTGRRAKILTHGVSPVPRFDGDTIRVFSDKSEASDWARDMVAEVVPTAEGAVDVWEVNLNGLPGEHYPHITDSPDLSVVGGFDADRVTLILTF